MKRLHDHVPTNYVPKFLVTFCIFQEKEGRRKMRDEKGEEEEHLHTSSFLPVFLACLIIVL